MTVTYTPSKPRPRFTTAALLVAVCAGVGASASYGQTVAEPAPAPATPAAVALADAPPVPATLPPQKAQEGRHDFSQVLGIFAKSITPARTEMGTAVQGFGLAMDEANRLMDRGEYQAAIDVSLEAINGMLDLRNRIVDPLLDGQEKMVDEIGPLRESVAKSLLEQPTEQRTGVDAFDDRTRRELTQLARQHRDATTANAQRLAMQKFRTKLRLAQLKQRAKSSEQRVIQVRQRLLERLDQMHAVLGELSINAELTFSSLDGQAKLLEQYRDSLQMAKTAQEAEAALAEAFGTLGFGGSLTEMEDKLMDFGNSIDDQLVAVLDSLSDTSQRTAGPGSNADTVEIMNQLLQAESENTQ